MFREKSGKEAFAGEEVSNFLSHRGYDLIRLG